MSEQQHAAAVGQRRQHCPEFTDANGDGVPDELVAVLAQTRSLKLWAEQFSGHVAAPDALAVSRWAEREIGHSIEMWRAEAALQADMQAERPSEAELKTAVETIERLTGADTEPQAAEPEPPKRTRGKAKGE